MNIQNESDGSDDEQVVEIIATKTRAKRTKKETLNDL